MSAPTWDPNAFDPKPGSDKDRRWGPFQRNGNHRGRSRNGPESNQNGSSRFAYAEARLRPADEARSDDLKRDPRVYLPDPDEDSTRPCGAPVKP